MRNKKKRCFVVVGTESSGTKFLTKLFILAGCYGDSWHKQRLDEKVPQNEKNIVFRRSFPHGGDTPSLQKIEDRFSKLGYEVKFIFLIRSMQFVIESRKRKNSFNLMQIKDGFSSLGYQIGLIKGDYIWITYESLLLYKKQVLKYIFEWAELSMPQDGFKIKDGNKKYLRKKKRSGRK